MNDRHRPLARRCIGCGKEGQVIEAPRKGWAGQVVRSCVACGQKWVAKKT